MQGKTTILFKREAPYPARSHLSPVTLQVYCYMFSTIFNDCILFFMAGVPTAPHSTALTDNIYCTLVNNPRLYGQVHAC